MKKIIVSIAIRNYIITLLNHEKNILPNL